MRKSVHASLLDNVVVCQTNKNVEIFNMCIGILKMFVNNKRTKVRASSPRVIYWVGQTEERISSYVTHGTRLSRRFRSEKGKQKHNTKSEEATTTMFYAG